jgi:hypothetical protein
MVFKTTIPLSTYSEVQTNKSNFYSCYNSLDLLHDWVVVVVMMMITLMW